LFAGDVTSVAALEAWLVKYSQGRLLRHSIRQPMPETPEYINGVLTLVHDNFRSTVFDDDKDVIVFFYLPGMHHNLSLSLCLSLSVSASLIECM
jgi:hypothetical protein